MARPLCEEPSLCHHKPTGQAYVRFRGSKPIYCGRWGTKEARDKHRVLVANWIAGGRQPPTESKAVPTSTNGRTLTEVIEPYWEFAQGYYVKNGQPTREVSCIKMALKVWRQHYGDVPAVEFDSLKMLALQDLMIKTGWARKTINDSMSRVRRAMKWMVSRKLIPPTVLHECSTVTGLEKGRSKAKETAPVRPVPEAHIDAVKRWVSRQVWALIQLQLLTGARPGEVLRLRKQDIDRSGKVWTSIFSEHKTVHHGHERRLYFGPEAQAVLTPFLLRPDDAYLFSPDEAERERKAMRHEARTTPESCGNTIGSSRKRRPRWAPGDWYGRDAYRVAIARACDAAFPPPEQLRRLKVPARKGKKARRWETSKEWRVRLGKDKWAELEKWREAHRWHPHQLRHNAATRIRAKYGAEAAKLAIGVRNMDVAEIYAERDFGLVERIMAEVG